MIAGSARMMVPTAPMNWHTVIGEASSEVSAPGSSASTTGPHFPSGQSGDAAKGSRALGAIAHKK